MDWLKYLVWFQKLVHGKKTYIVAVIASLTALSAWAAGELTGTQFIAALFAAAQTVFIRAGIAKGNGSP